MRLTTSSALVAFLFAQKMPLLEEADVEILL